MLARTRFYASKVPWLWYFFWHGCWQLFRDEWKMTFQEAQDAEARFDEIHEEAVGRLLRRLGGGTNGGP